MLIVAQTPAIKLLLLIISDLHVVLTCPMHQVPSVGNIIFLLQQETLMLEQVSNLHWHHGCHMIPNYVVMNVLLPMCIII
jgi:hypothetical protein